MRATHACATLGLLVFGFGCSSEKAAESAAPDASKSARSAIEAWPFIQRPVATRIERRGDAALHPVFPDRAHPKKSATVALPLHGDEPFVLRDETSGATVAVRSPSMAGTTAQVVDGYVLYRSTNGGPTVIHRPTPEGVEDFVTVDEPMSRTGVTYQITLSTGIEGLRLVADTLEMIDSGGVPRLRVAPPWIVDARGARHDAILAVEGCAVDTNPAAPFGRAPVAPGSRDCTVRVTWPGGVEYPAVLDPNWTITGFMISLREAHTPVTLPGGLVLVAGGGVYGSVETAKAELFSPAFGTWTATSSMNIARRAHSMTLLANGHVLAAGGMSGYGTPVYYQTAQEYDPSTGNWTAVGPLQTPRAAHTATLLTSGKVLIAAGADGTDLTACELFDPTSQTFAPTGSLGHEVTNASYSWLLMDGRALVAGTACPSSYFMIYNPVQGTWSPPVYMQAHMGGVAVTLKDGRPLFGLGRDCSGPNTPYTEAFELNSLSWVDIGALPAASMTGAASVVLSDGRVLVAGGNIAGAVATTWVFDPDTQLFSAGPHLLWSREHSGAAAIIGPNGPSVLVSGGFDGTQTTNSAEVYLEKSPVGIPCSNGGDCGSGYCVDGYCCDAACGGACDKCSNPGFLGICSPAPKGNAGNPPCTPYLCDGSNPACPTTCLDDTTCTLSFCDSTGHCHAPYPNGTACARNAQCTSSFCADGFCCNAACNTGACDRCDLTGFVGTCKIAPAGNAGSPQCKPYVCDGAYGTCPVGCLNETNCANGYTCSAGSCVPKPGLGTPCTQPSQCQSGFCSDSVCCDQACTGACDACTVALGAIANGNCTNIPGPGSPPCTPYVCGSNGGNCPTTCTLDAECIAGDVCINSHCASKLAQGAACTASTQCQSGFCVDGFCCNSECTSTCKACSLAKTGAANGTCSNVKDGTDPDSQCPADAFACTTAACMGGACTQQLNAGQCLVSGGCYSSGQQDPSNECLACTPSISTTAFSVKTNGTVCSGDGFSCTTDVCQGGTCQHTQSPNSCIIGGTCYAANDPDPNNPCQACVPNTSASQWSVLSNGTSCLDDGLSCTVDTCQSGICQHNLAASTCLIGEACYSANDPSPGNSCQACLPAQTTSQWSTKADGAACQDDSLACTTDTCQSGVCQHPLAADTCLIAGTCYQAHAEDPIDDCKACTPASSTSQWSTKADGATCTLDSKDCTLDICASGTCTHPQKTNTCLIAGACFAPGLTNPNDACQNCSPGDDATGWTQIPGCVDAGLADASDATTADAHDASDAPVDSAPKPDAQHDAAGDAAGEAAHDGAAGAGGASSAAPTSSDSGGCGCRTASQGGAGRPALLALMVAALMLRRRRFGTSFRSLFGGSRGA